MADRVSDTAIVVSVEQRPLPMPEARTMNAPTSGRVHPRLRAITAAFEPTKTRMRLQLSRFAYFAVGKAQSLLASRSWRANAQRARPRRTGFPTLESAASAAGANSTTEDGA